MVVSAAKSKKLHELAQRLAPGRSVRRITLDFPVKGVATATVEVHLERDELDAVMEAVEDVQPEVVIVEVAPIVVPKSFPPASPIPGGRQCVVGSAVVNGVRYEVIARWQRKVFDEEAHAGLWQLHGTLRGQHGHLVSTDFQADFSGFTIPMKVWEAGPHEAVVRSCGAPTLRVASEKSLYPEPQIVESPRGP